MGRHNEEKGEKKGRRMKGRMMKGRRMKWREGIKGRGKKRDGRKKNNCGMEEEERERHMKGGGVGTIQSNYSIRLIINSLAFMDEYIKLYNFSFLIACTKITAMILTHK